LHSDIIAHAVLASITKEDRRFINKSSSGNLNYSGFGVYTFFAENVIAESLSKGLMG
jgi:hypothetical protein